MRAIAVYIILLINSAIIPVTGYSQYLPETSAMGERSLAFRWGDIAMKCTANDTERFRPRPTITSRYLALIWTAVYDAWSRYDDRCEPLYLTAVQRRPAGDRNISNKEIAVSYAAFRSMLMFFPDDSLLLSNMMLQLKLDPSDTSLNSNTPVGIGNLAARTVSSARLYDGSNQTGTENGINQQPYTDYTSYLPANTVDVLHKPGRWQPKYFSDGNGGQFAPACLTPHWGRVKPLLIDSANQFRPIPPPAIGSQKLNKEIEQVVMMQANLTDEQRALL
ncbi:MAG: haloperoxidase, partial [Sphingobacteriales bacterium]